MTSSSLSFFTVIGCLWSSTWQTDSSYLLDNLLVLAANRKVWKDWTSATVTSSLKLVILCSNQLQNQLHPLDQSRLFPKKSSWTKMSSCHLHQSLLVRLRMWSSENLEKYFSGNNVTIQPLNTRPQVKIAPTNPQTSPTSTTNPVSQPRPGNTNHLNMLNTGIHYIVIIRFFSSQTRPQWSADGLKSWLRTSRLHHQLTILVFSRCYERYVECNQSSHGDHPLNNR